MKVIRSHDKIYLSENRYKKPKKTVKSLQKKKKIRKS